MKWLKGLLSIFSRKKKTDPVVERLMDCFYPGRNLPIQPQHWQKVLYLFESHIPRKSIKKQFENVGLVCWDGDMSSAESLKKIALVKVMEKHHLTADQALETFDIFLADGADLDEGMWYNKFVITKAKKNVTAKTTESSAAS